MRRAPRRARDVVAAAGEHAADRAAEPLGQRYRDEVEGRGQLGEGVPGGGGGVEQARAVEIALDAELLRRGADRLRLALRKNDAAAAVVGVLDRDEAGRRVDDVPRRLVRRAQIGGGEEPALADRQELHPGIGRTRTRFVPDDVRLVAEDDLVAGPRQDLQRDLVGHCAARHKECGFLAEQFGDALLQVIDRGVLAILVVADRCRSHRLPHSGRGPGHSVGTKVDRVHRSLLVSCLGAGADWARSDDDTTHAAVGTAVIGTILGRASTHGRQRGDDRGKNLHKGDHG